MQQTPLKEKDISPVYPDFFSSLHFPGYLFSAILSLSARFWSWVSCSVLQEDKGGIGREILSQTKATEAATEGNPE